MKILMYFSFIILFSACNKQLDPNLPLKEGIAGKWKLVKINFTNYENKNYIITFDSSGMVTASDYKCAGTYTFNEDGGKELHDNNLIVRFTDCESTERLWYTIRGHANAQFIDANTLVLNNINCDEGCARFFKRIN